jgi:excisionase family DNA binding protein
MSNVIAFPTPPEPAEHQDSGQGDDAPYVGEVPTIDPGRLTYTVDETAYLLNLSRGLAYQYVREGVIPAERLGRRWLVPRRRFHAWLDGLTDEGGN